MIFDTHAHYNDPAFDEDRDILLSSMARHNVGTILNVGADLPDCRASVELAHRYPFIYAAVGVHPDHVGSIDDAFWDWMHKTAAEDSRVVAIGEIGLDYHWDVEPREFQKEWFIRQMDLARELELPIIIHSRDAAQDTMEIMQEHAQGLHGVMHCYSYSPEMAQEYVKMGFFLGVGGVLTFKNGKKLKKTVEAVPIEHLLLETDCPYMAPEPYRGSRNNSIYIDEVAQTMAELKGMQKDEVIRICTANAERLFRCS